MEAPPEEPSPLPAPSAPTGCFTPPPPPPTYSATCSLSGPASRFWDPSLPASLAAASPPLRLASLPVACTDAALSTLLASSLSVSLVLTPPAGEGGEPPPPVVVGAASYPLAELFDKDVAEPLDATLLLPPPPGEEGEQQEGSPEEGSPGPPSPPPSVSLSLSLCDALSDFLLGGASLSLSSLSVSSLPDSFKVLPPFDAATTTAAEHHAAIQAVVSPPAGEDGVRPPPPQAFAVALSAAGVLPALTFEAQWVYEPGPDGPPVEVPLTEGELAQLKEEALKKHEEEEKARAEARAKEREAAGEEKKEGSDEAPEEGSDEAPSADEAPPFSPSLPSTRAVPTPTGSWSLLALPPPGSPSLAGGRFFLSLASLRELRKGPPELPVKVTLTRTGAPPSFGAPGDDAGDPKADPKAKKGKPKGKLDEAEPEPPLELTGELRLGEMLQPDALTCAASAQLQSAPADAPEGGPPPAPLSATASVRLALSACVVPPVPAALALTRNMGTVVGERQWKPKAKPRDVAAELRAALGDIAAQVAGEIRALGEPAGGWDEARLFRAVQASGGYFEMKERLLPFVQRAAHSRFREKPATPAQAEAYRSQLFAALSTQLNAVLVNLFTRNRAVDAALFPQPADEFARDVQLLALRANEAEAAGDRAAAGRRREDACALGARAFETGDEAGRGMLADAWDEQAMWRLRAGEAGGRDRALECIKRSEGVRELGPGVALKRALAQVDGGVFDEAEASLGAALRAAEAGGDAGVLTSSHAGLVVLHTIVDELEAATYKKDREELRQRGLPMATFHKRDLGRARKAKAALAAAAAAARAEGGAPPRRAAVVALVGVAAACVDSGLFAAGGKALELAAKCEALAAGKEEELGIEPSAEVKKVWGRRARLEATVAFGEGDVPGCLEFGKKATEWDEGSGLSWEILGKGLEASMDVEGAAAAYKSSEQKFGDDVPIRIYLKLADLCVRAEAYEKAKEAAFKATKKYGSGAAWKIAAVASMKLGEWENARKCFEESLRIDPYSASAWAYLSLFTLEKDGAVRVEDAVVAAKQAVSHDLGDSHLLRQLGEKLFLAGELGLAEDMLRRSLVLQGSSISRRLLGDVLRAQKRLDESLKEYMVLLEDEDFTHEEKQELFYKVSEDLKVLKKEKERSEFIEQYAMYLV
ncbi:hypothetical protein TeGR_g4744 [Tetraparma gracilis]|uniref:Tetratricopeptide repeat-containing protein n=1 Tax=Tetraparma gracilis TaxID=2962635 RepID=A0ABQ6N4G0_9STRA|nr:hypothetical protein TeGR_g4744 [Tetraparma gracilis]